MIGLIVLIVFFILSLRATVIAWQMLRDDDVLVFGTVTLVLLTGIVLSVVSS